jgi:NAD(P)-dependent dehydrogenase (short-subunit alcohol dehydrogenase family)
MISAEPSWGLSLAAGWAADGDTVTAVLCDQAAAAARRGHADAEDVRSALAAGASVAAHDEALSRRGIPTGAIDVLVDGVRAVDLDALADLVSTPRAAVVWV